ncbi:serine hydrolase [Asbolus verrucosus]|uniref:Serine hydrolase n=1 Tax=Asbolus verrucosus TaxID=1661398 RepID=A0A482WBE2_ASBVE|nr:serine hydrolase [Asbolus verrucosus]
MSYREGERDRERRRDDRDREDRRYRSRSRSRSDRRYKSSRYSHSHSRSPGDRRSLSHSPMSSRRRHMGTRDNPKPSRCLGVFGLSVYTTEDELYHIFSKYGPLERVQVVIDAKTGRSRGFSFVYFENTEDAKVAKDQCTGMKINGKNIRVDYSITERAHTPTPGIYMGKPTYKYNDRYDRRRDRESRLIFQKFSTSALTSHVRFNSTLTDFQEIRIPVPWGHVAGKWWGPTDQRPILTLHGWQDNCGTFNRLIPLLNRDVGFLAIDFPGHGYSSRIPSGLYCHYTDYLILVQYLINYFQWPKISLMGHSLGGITSFMYTMINPKNVDFLICLDGAKPMVPENALARIARNIEKFPRYEQFERSSKEPPSYTMEEIKQKICTPNKNSVAFEHSHHLVQRNVAPSKINPGKYYFTRDPRLKVGELMSWPQEESVAHAKHMTCPMLIAKAIGGSYYEVKENFYQVLDILKVSSVDCQYHRLEGTHHFHLNNPEILSHVINKFIEKHNVQDRSVGGIKEEMVQFKAAFG